MKISAIVGCLLIPLFLSSCAPNSVSPQADSSSSASSTFEFTSEAQAQLAKSIPDEQLEKLRIFMVRDFDNDGIGEGFAVIGEEIADKYLHYYGSLYFVTQNTAVKILDDNFAFNRPISIKVKGQLLIAFVTTDFNDGERGYIYKVKDNEAVLLPINGTFRELDLDDSLMFRHTDTDRMINPDGTPSGEITRKNYWFRWLDGELIEFSSSEITTDEFKTFNGGQAAVSAIESENAVISNIIKRDNKHVDVNYVKTDANGARYNFYRSFKPDEDDILLEIGHGEGHYKLSIQT